MNLTQGFAFAERPGEGSRAEGRCSFSLVQPVKETDGGLRARP